MVSAEDKGYDRPGGTFVFCPNCGTQNDSAATPCKKCGFKLSGISVPKFKGTMMLNSDQTVAEMIEEHRKKQAQGGAAEKPKARASEPAPRRSPGSSAPPSSLGGPRGPVLQPPRVAASSRGRMGGTMLGVAPQVGGHSPQRSGATPDEGAPPATTPLPAAPGTSTASDDASSDSSQSETAASARVEASIVTPDTHATPEGLDGIMPPTPRHETRSSSADDAPEPSPAVTPTRPLAAMPSSGSSVPAVPPSSEGDEPQLDAVAEPQIRGRAVAPTAALPSVAETAAAEPEPLPPAPPVEAKPPVPARLRPLDIVLIIGTFGIYGVVLWARQRKSRA